MRPPRHPFAASDPLTAAAVAGSVAMTVLSLAVGTLGLPGFGTDGVPAARQVTEAPAHVVVVAPAPAARHAS